MHIHGSSLDGIQGYRGFLIGKKQDMADLLEDAANAPPEAQEAILTRMLHIRNDVAFADKVVDVIVKNITQLQL